MILPDDNALISVGPQLKPQRDSDKQVAPRAVAMLRRVLDGLARRGLDLRPPLRALRDQLARPAEAPPAPAPPALAPPAEVQPTPPPSPVPEVAETLPGPPIAPALPADSQATRAERLERLLLTPWPDLPVHGPLVSVIMPTRDRAGLIGAAIASVQAQSYQDWELIIVDDGSTDDTATVVAPHLTDQRISLHRQTAAGASAARNAGLARAHGALVAYLDSDNLWEPEFLRRLVPTFADPAVATAYGALVLEDAAPGAPRVLWEEFDPARLAEGNFIDLNVFMHRRALIASAGGFDEELRRLADWDLILRLTAATPALPVPALAARYRTTAPRRISEVELYHPAYRRIRAKGRHATPTARAIRVLYLLWHYPQASEMYIEAEIQGLRRLGVHVEVWSEVVATTPYAADTPVHHGTLEAAIAAARPDVIHSHWLNIAANFLDEIAARGLQISVRGHGFDVAGDFIRRVADHPAVRVVYLYEQQLAEFGAPHPKVKVIRNAFETTLFKPAVKDPRLVFRAAAALPAKDLPMFLHLAKSFPAHRFVLAIAACNLMESYVGELLALRREMESPAEILVNAPHAEVARLMGEAGIYLHTVVAPAAGGTPLGQPVSIAEAMASGCYMLVRDLPALTNYVAEAGDAYRDPAHAAALIGATAAWSPAEWTRRARLSEERGWTLFAGDDAFHMIREDWAAIVNATA